MPEIKSKFPLLNEKITAALVIGIAIVASAAETPPASQNLVLTAPIRAWDEVIPLGNGLMGGLPWGDGPGLEVLMFQMGRYLLASSSRPGGLPANLQGLWNDSNSPMWAGDYHNNINLQMACWPAETTNLSECQVPLIDFIVAAEEPCRIAKRKAFGANTRGWTARTSQNIFGGNGWEWNIPSSAWYAQHVFEHWAFTRDRDYV